MALFLLLGTSIAQTEVLIWIRSSSYDNSSLVPPEKIPFIRYNIYYGESPFGPWNFIAQVSDNSLVLPTPVLPSYGGTRYYTGDAELDNMVSGKGDPLKYVRPIPQSPGCTTTNAINKA